MRQLGQVCAPSEFVKSACPRPSSRSVDSTATVSSRRHTCAPNLPRESSLVDKYLCRLLFPDHGLGRLEFLNLANVGTCGYMHGTRPLQVYLDSAYVFRRILSMCEPGTSDESFEKS